eukprot:44529_1
MTFLSFFLICHFSAITNINYAVTNTFDLININYTIPSVDTIYYCKYFKFPQLSQLHHIIRADAIISPGNEDIVHHIVISTCSHFNPLHLGIGGICNDIKHKLIGTICEQKSIIMWAKGMGPFIYPKHVGLELRSNNNNNSAEYVQVEWHYNNPNKIKNTLDNSGIRITYTSLLRPYSVDIMRVSSITHTIFIPGGIPKNTIYGYCPSNCTLNLPNNGINIIAALLHTHNVGIGGKFQHIRNGKLLKTIITSFSNNTYFQPNIFLKEEIIILPGDDIIIYCYYDTTHHVMPVYGGPSSHDEMCGYLFIVYPKQNMIDLEICTTEPLLNNFKYMLNNAILNGYWNGTDWPWDHKNGFYNVSTNESLNNYLNYSMLRNVKIKCKPKRFNALIP